MRINSPTRPPPPGAAGKHLSTSTTTGVARCTACSTCSAPTVRLAPATSSAALAALSACSENMVDLGGLGQRMQVGGTCRRHRCPRCLARSRSVRALGCLKRRPSCVAQRFPTLTTPSELPRRTNRVSRPRVVRLIGLEYLEYHLRTPRGKRGDRTKILLAQNDLARFPCHGSIFDTALDSKAAGRLRAAHADRLPMQHCSTPHTNHDRRIRKISPSRSPRLSSHLVCGPRDSSPTSARFQRNRQ